ncbi:P-loop containing nucleoside triphosphate hydrolase protein [Cylindrobasidium torrendii FP15055 ss-10]|uniref:DNA 3'-5' helicase n=1 Tax=Cylindrobasidium torrendii FP15055 ss-10 TaxID=1314674 RepID=A0A0D7BJN1_9AGAR|nr:P-loop containing nucleoside triphosphate hydrolase protein [Cylindrobasidium torrendii FP15055 ss-10]
MAPILDRIDEEILKDTKDKLCSDFGIPEIRPFQEEAGIHILRGRHTILDVPTGGGKTLALWFALYYHIISAKRLGTQSKAAVIVISPLVALMTAQAKALNERGIRAVALTSQIKDLVGEFKRVANGDYRVVLLGPEMQDNSDFKNIVLQSKPFLDNLIQFSVDEAHCISEWGPDFRPTYGRLIELIRRLPNTVPQLIVSATLPKDVMDDVRLKLHLGDDFRVISVSNRKPNVALSVRTLQHAQDSFADLVSLFPATSPESLPQTIIYVNSRTIAERMQDFLRAHAPPNLSSKAIRFYHRYLSDEEKAEIERDLRSGILRIVIATDALGMVRLMSVPYVCV